MIPGFFTAEKKKRGQNRTCSNISSCTQAVKAAKRAQIPQPTAGQRQPAAN